LATLFADENFPQQVVAALRARGHDVLTAYEAGLANQRVRDEDILSEATRLGRMVLTLNRWEFVRLHAAHPEHSGDHRLHSGPRSRWTGDRSWVVATPRGSFAESTDPLVDLSHGQSYGALNPFPA
jgi:hypothetical protein